MNECEHSCCSLRSKRLDEVERFARDMRDGKEILHERISRHITTYEQAVGVINQKIDQTFKDLRALNRLQGELDARVAKLEHPAKASDPTSKIPTIVSTFGDYLEGRREMSQDEFNRTISDAVAILRSIE